MSMNKPQQTQAQTDETIDAEIKSVSNFAEGTTMAKLEQLSLPERELTTLVQDYRQQLQALKHRENLLEQRENRINLMQMDMEGSIRQFQAESAKLDAATKRLRQERKDLATDKITYAQAEKLGLKKSAAMLSSMEPEKASATLTSLIRGGSMKDVLLMLDMIQDRKSGEILGLMDAELVKELLQNRKNLREGDITTSP